MRIKPLVLILCVAAFCAAMGFRQQLGIWVGTGSAALFSVVLLGLFARPELGSLLRPPWLGSLVVGVAAGIVMSIATWWLYPISVAIFPPIEREVQTLYSLLRQPPGPVRAFPVLVFVVVAEEWVWRGLAIDLFSGARAPWRAVVASALVYVLPQLALGSPLLMVVALVCGLVWGALRVTRESLIAPLAAHIIWNLFVFVLYPVTA